MSHTGDLDEEWRATAAVPAGWELGGVTFHGPGHPGPWIAFLFQPAKGKTGGPEGSGTNAVEALEDLRKALVADQSTETW